MKVAMVAGAGVCLGIGIFLVFALRLLLPAVGVLAGGAHSGPLAIEPLINIQMAAAVLLAVVALLALLRARLLSGRRVDSAPTWGCGYAHPSSRMQYSATSFVDPIRGPFASILRAHVVSEPPVGYFPLAARYEDRVRDMAGERVLVPVWRRFLRLNSRLRVIQSGRMQLYLVYVLVTLVALLLWQIGGALGL